MAVWIEQRNKTWKSSKKSGYFSESFPLLDLLFCLKEWNDSFYLQGSEYHRIISKKAKEL